MVAAFLLIWCKRQTAALPTPDLATVEVHGLDPNTKYTVALFDLAGRRLQTYEAIAGTNVELQQNELVTGVYLVNIYSNAGMIGTAKVVVR
jgi:hypothetical protein